jgi:hypothetical protein
MELVYGKPKTPWDQVRLGRETKSPHITQFKTQAPDAINDG